MKRSTTKPSTWSAREGFNILCLALFIQSIMSVESISAKTIAALRVLHNALKGEGVRSAVMGSLSHALQGLKFQPNDIDISTDRRGAHKIEQLLEPHVTLPSPTARETAYAPTSGSSRYTASRSRS